MKIKLFCIFFILWFSLLSAQEVQKFDTILKIENLKFHPKEIRVYKNYSTSTGLELFRMFYDENDKINIEFYYTVANKTEGDGLKLRIKKKKLNSFKNPEFIWLQLIYSKIIHLPEFEQIKYKMASKPRILLDEEGELGAEITNPSIFLDGHSYYVQIKMNEEYNNLEYPNPENYLNKFPQVDEFIIFNDFLSIIKEEFRIFKD